MFFQLPNLASTSVSECPAPWEFSQQAPDDVRGKEGKKHRDKWISNPLLNWQVYSAAEGVNPSARISEPKVGDEGNPVLRLHAFVCDYDTQVTEEEMLAGLKRIKFQPNYLERTLSGNARLIFLFEKPVLLPNRKFATEFLKLALHKAHFEAVAPALDKPAFEDVGRYWTNSGEWRVGDVNARVPHDLLQGWIVEVSEKHAWRKDRGAIDIPLPVIWTELQKKWPGLAEKWPGDFVEGSQGPSFWVAGSESPKSCIVKPTGIYTFAAHATKPFWGWADLLGKSFCDDYTSQAMGKAVEGIFHDGKSWYRLDGYGEYKPFSKEDIALHLQANRGLSNSKDGETLSEVNRALAYVQNWNGINGAAPFVYQPAGIIKKSGNRFLNTSTVRVCQPAREPGIWGPNGNFPFISLFLDGFFHPKSRPHDVLPAFLSWVSRFYVGAYELNPNSGQNVFLLGKPEVGKTLWNQLILASLMGGAVEAQDYLLGNTTFNSHLFASGVWCVDDSSATISSATQRAFSSMCKKLAANTTFSYEEKFRVACMVEWSGRVSVTANADEVSASIVPELSLSNLDKTSLFRTADTPPVVFPARRELQKIVHNELPFFARFLLDYNIPQEWVGTARFGVKAYHEESLMQVAEQSSRNAGALEILEDWRSNYFSDNPTKLQWVGTSYKLLKELHKDDLAREAGLRGITVSSLGQHLSALKSKGVAWIDSQTTATERLWTIRRADPVSAAPLPTGSSFSK